MSEQGLAACAAALKASRRLILAAHVNPDADGLGSALAMALALRSLGKQAWVALDGPLPESLQFLPWGDVLQEQPGPFDTALVLDSPEVSRTGRLAPVLQACPCLVVVDHHPSVKPYGTHVWVDPSAAASGELAHALIIALSAPLTADIALALYAALADDTGSFRYSNTSPRTHRLAAELLEAGVKPYAVAQQLFDSYTPQSLRLLSAGLARIQLLAEGRLGLVVIERGLIASCGAQDEDAAGIINYVRGLKGVEAAAVLREGEGQHRVSLRSRGRVDVAAVARPFGGGGHAAAAGLTLSGELKPALAALTSALEAALKGLPA
jgi:phosphoesterase RecJ-like protein